MDKDDGLSLLSLQCLFGTDRGMALKYRKLFSTCGWARAQGRGAVVRKADGQIIGVHFLLAVLPLLNEDLHSPSMDM